MSDRVTPASPDAVRAAGWLVSVNGEIFPGARHVSIENERFGTLSFGRRPEGTIGWGWKEVGGGGVGIVPYSVFEGKLVIGLILQDRHFMSGGQASNIPRGFLDLAKTHFETATREFTEEVGWKAPHERLESLDGSPANSNSTFFDTTDGGGFRYFCFEAYSLELERTLDGVVFKAGLIKPVSAITERILGCSFVPWEVAATVADNFSNAGVARLLASKRELLQYL